MATEVDANVELKEASANGGAAPAQESSTKAAPVSEGGSRKSRGGKRSSAGGVTAALVVAADAGLTDLSADPSPAEPSPAAAEEVKVEEEGPQGQQQQKQEEEQQQELQQQVEQAQEKQQEQQQDEQQEQQQEQQEAQEEVQQQQQQHSEPTEPAETAETAELAEATEIIRSNSGARTVAGTRGAGKGVVPTNPTAEVVRACDTADEVRSSPVRVTEMAKELTEHFEAGGGNGGVNGAAAGADRGDGGVSASRAASGVALTQHDLVNTANVALVLQAGEFKLRPGVDVVPYEELKELRLEDGLDVSRKEEYLSNEEFTKIFGMEKDEFRAMPNWKRITVKKAKGLF
ncbi:hypothetical protein MNEG_0682 [Monoraphidium neglectum]|uniref:HP domain-containing protein n=1 Tax=Monoraphidium neglectum TaxID=145388 RepID=A0A0D2LLM9_9CHLO|nr:hypothetical protein MNEG_0682 [Monoraphidium neglectum]KIZ07269.1 hypothetical protein MNEG_0682 [Monoraphidium neglectum]|eukprot:XP_013906288.1 hypothetical protein MNEG_0682 [Monoraphidium neglectum]